MSNKLTTANGVLEWAGLTGVVLWNEAKTAAYIAECVRIAEIVRRDAVLYGDSDENWERQILAEAEKENG